MMSVQDSSSTRFINNTNHSDTNNNNNEHPQQLALQLGNKINLVQLAAVVPTSTAKHANLAQLHKDVNNLKHEHANVKIAIATMLANFKLELQAAQSTTRTVQAQSFYDFRAQLLREVKQTLHDHAAQQQFVSAATSLNTNLNNSPAATAMIAATAIATAAQQPNNTTPAALITTYGQHNNSLAAFTMQVIHWCNEKWYQYKTAVTVMQVASAVYVLMRKLWLPLKILMKWNMFKFIKVFRVR